MNLTLDARQLELIKKTLFLQACGVDNWSGYSDAWQLFTDWENESEDE